jgi:hypothetical protein
MDKKERLEDQEQLDQMAFQDNKASQAGQVTLDLLGLLVLQEK